MQVPVNWVRFKTWHHAEQVEELTWLLCRLHRDQCQLWKHFELSGRSNLKGIKFLTNNGSPFGSSQYCCISHCQLNWAVAWTSCKVRRAAAHTDTVRKPSRDLPHNLDTTDTIQFDYIGSTWRRGSSWRFYTLGFNTIKVQNAHSLCGYQMHKVRKFPSLAIY
jgi:hypothetical protein